MMGLLDFFRRRKAAATKENTVKTSIPEEEKKYYKDDAYYTNVAFEGSPFEMRVVTFEERKETAIPSRNGLYPAEILLLKYCTYGSYPRPKNGYPGFWWFEYGIRDVGSALKKLEDRGFICYVTAKESLKRLKVAELKAMLSSKKLPLSGKKADLIMRVSEAFSERELLATDIQRKYKLTRFGEQELAENEYVAYMHNAEYRTTEDSRLGMTYNVWSINKLLGKGDKADWRKVVAGEEQKIRRIIEDNKAKYMEDLKRNNPELYKTIKDQDIQLEIVQTARKEYEDSNDIGKYIGFWEEIWGNGGLLFRSSRWHFELVELYMKAMRYEDALRFVYRLKKERNEYEERADAYIRKIEILIERQTRKVLSNKGGMD